MAGDFSVVIYGKKNKQPNTTTTDRWIISPRKCNKAQAYPNFTKTKIVIFHNVPDKGFVRVELGGGGEGGHSMTFIQRIGIFGEFCTNAPQVFQAQVLVWFMPS